MVQQLGIHLPMQGARAKPMCHNKRTLKQQRPSAAKNKQIKIIIMIFVNWKTSTLRTSCHEEFGIRASKMLMKLVFPELYLDYEIMLRVGGQME